MLANTPPDKEVSDDDQPETEENTPTPNRLLLQTLDGLHVDDPRCTACNRRLREGTEVLAHTYLDGTWFLDSLYCTECYPTEQHSLDRSTEEAIVEGRLAARDDQATQRRYPVLYTQGRYKVIRHTDLRSQLKAQRRHNAVLTAVVRGLIEKVDDLRDRVHAVEMTTDAHGKQLEKVRASIKESPRTVLDGYDRDNGWTDLQTRVQELELEVNAEDLSRFDRLSKMSTRQLQQDSEVSTREAWAVFLLRNFDGWSKEVGVGDVWFVSDGMKRMFYQHLDLDVGGPSEVSTKKAHRACDKAMELTDEEVLWVKLEKGRALVRPKDENGREKLEERVKRTGN